MKNGDCRSQIEPLIPPDRFTGLEAIAHLCTGGEGPWLEAHGEVYDRFARWKSGGSAGRAEIYRVGEQCRGRVGELWGVPAERIGFLPTAAEGMGWLARGMDWRDGDNVVTTNLEFPSVAYACVGSRRSAWRCGWCRTGIGSFTKET